MSKQFAIALFVIVLCVFSLVSCSAPQSPLDDVSRAATMTVGVVEITATAEARDLAIVQGLVAQTRIAQDLQATAEAKAATAEAVQATQAAQTQVANATATQAAFVLIQATAQAVQVATDQAWQRERWLATATAEAIQATQAAHKARETAQATVTLAFLAMKATAEAAEYSAQAEIDTALAGEAKAAHERTLITNRFMAWWSVVAWPLYLLLLIIIILIIYRLYLSNRIIKRDARGIAPLILANGTLIQPDQMPLHYHDPKNPIVLQPDQMLRLAENAMKVRAIQAMQSGGALPARALANAIGKPEQPEVTPMPALLPAVADWGVMQGWRGDGLAFPLGVGANGLIISPFDAAPHLLYVGTSGSGKSRMGLRPLAAAALVSGWQVVTIDKSGVDFTPHLGHPNFHYVQVDRNKPNKVVDLMRALYGLVVTRQESLAANGFSTWDRWPGRPGPFVLCIIDEFSNLSDLLDTRAKENFWRWARMVAAEARKSGVLLALALQDPTAESIDLRIRRNCKPVIYRTGDDHGARQLVRVDGASRQPTGHFMTVINGLVEGVGFKPSDPEISEWISLKSVPNYPEPEWIDAEYHEIDVPASGDLTAKRERVLQLHGQGYSLRKIEEKVFGYTGGNAHAFVKSAVDGATTTASHGQNPCVVS